MTEESSKRPKKWEVICSIEDGIIPFLCGATVSAGLTIMIEASFKWMRFVSGICMFLASAFIFLWFVCLSSIKREISENSKANEARFLSDSVIWETYYSPRKKKMKIFLIFASGFTLAWIVFLTLSYINSSY